MKEIEKGSVVIMDNAAAHKRARLFAIADASGIRLIFQPAYSPDLNKIEHFWAWLKKKLRVILPFFSSLEDAICEAFKCYTDEFCYSFNV